MSYTLHHFSVRNGLVEAENKGLREALVDKKKHKKKGKVLPLEKLDEYNGGAMFYSPSRFQDAWRRHRDAERAEQEKQLQKASDKQLKDAQKLVKQKQLAERKAEREAKAERSRVEKAEKAAAAEQKK